MAAQKAREHQAMAVAELEKAVAEVQAQALADQTAEYERATELLAQ